MKHSFRPIGMTVLLLLLVSLLALTLVSCSNEEDIPEGMQICSGGTLEYVFYVPNGWIVNTGSGTSSAYYSLNEPSSVRVASVLVSSYSPEQSLDIDGYWDICEKDYQDSLSAFTLISEGETTIFGGKDAKRYVYTAEISGTTYQFQQVITVHNNMFYTLTYTATTEAYESHLEELVKMQTEFKFR